MEKTGVKSKHNSRVGLWDKSYQGELPRQVYDDPASAKIAGGFLNQEEISTVEDWGCGYGGFGKFIGKQQHYIGVDGSKSQYASIIADLEHYSSRVDAIHMRHVLEHNPNWLSILKNSLHSFNKRMVLTLFTPFQKQTGLIARYPNFNNTGVEMIDIGFARQDIIKNFAGLKWFSIENIKTQTQYRIEHMFFLEK